MIERFFSYRDRWGNGLSLWVVVGMCFAAPLIALGLSRVRLENDVTSWLPADDPDAQVLHWFHKHFENESRILVSWEGSSLQDPRLARFQQALLAQGEFAAQFGEGHPERLIAGVATPVAGLETMVANKISPEDALQRLTGVLIGPGHLKVRWTAAGRANPEAAQQELQAAITAAGLDIPLEFLPPQTLDYSQLPQADVASQEQSTLDLAALSTVPQHDAQLRAPGLTYHSPTAASLLRITSQLNVVEDCFYAPGSPVAISLALTADGDELLQPVFEHIHAAALAVGIPAADLHLGGGPVSRYRLNREAARALWNTEYPAWQVHKRSPIILSTVATVILAFVLLRSFRLAALVLFASLYITMAVVALIPVTGKSLNLVLIVLPNLLMVLTTSGAVHLANYWKHEAAINPVHAIGRAVRIAWMPCLLASVTTAVGMASLLTSVLNPVKDFGIYAAIGTIMSLGMILIGFPALMAVWPGTVKPNSHAAQQSDLWRRLGLFLIKYSTPVVIINGLFMAVSVYGLYWFQTETKIIRYFPPQTRLYQDYEFLEESLAGIVSVEVIVHFPKRKEVDVTEDDDQETETPARPQLNVLQRMELVRALEEKLADHPGVSGTISLADFRPVSPDPEENLSRYMVTVRRTETAIFEEHVAETHALATRVTDPLHIETADRSIHFAAGDELWRIRCQTAVLNDLNYGQLVNDLQSIAQQEVSKEPGVQYVVTGMVPLFLRTQEAVLESLIESFALAFVLILIIMVILLRHPVSGVLSMLPNLFPVAVVFGLISWAGIPVDIGTMITASVALGIAIDGTLHLLTWFQEGIRAGLSREEAVVKSLQHCGPAMWQTSVAISIGMLLLIGADLLLISRFGWLMAALVFVALLGDVILLPALLVGWLGAIIERTTLKHPQLTSDIATELAAEHAAEVGIATETDDVISFPAVNAAESPTRRATGT